MLSRIFWFAIIICVLYMMAVFVIPEFTDKYGDKDFNTKIRNYKDASLKFASGWESPVSLFEKLKTTTTEYTDATKTQIKSAETIINTKINQTKEATQAIENAYSGIVDAKNKIQVLTGTGN